MRRMPVLLGLVILGFIAANSDAQSAAELKKTDSGYTITGHDKEAVTFEIDAKETGFLRAVHAGAKALVSDNKEPPLVASVLESHNYDGFNDFTGSNDSKVIPATYHLDNCTAEQKGNDVEVVTTGHLDWPGGDSIHFEMHSTLQSSGHAQVTVKATAQGAFKDRFIRDFGLHLPLALNERKRVAQGGDRGMRFDTRSEYQYHSHTKFLETPDFNFWQHFWVDQASPVDYQLWRSESLGTSALSEFRGRLAPGWTTVYDQQGGVLLSYKDMPLRAPKALYVNTRGSGNAVVYFHAPTNSALDTHDSAAAAKVFDCVHQTDWVFFPGDEFTVKPDQILEKIWSEKLASDAPERADDELAKINLLDAKLTAGVDAPLVVGGVPLPQGQVTALTQLSLWQDGHAVPVQTKLMGYWPDGSFKWVLLAFPLDPDKNLSITPSTGTGQEVPLTITLRNDKVDPDKRNFVLRYGKDVSEGKTTSPLKASEAGGNVEINTGPLELKLGKGKNWLQEAKLNGRSLLRSDSNPMSYADFIRMDHYSPNTTHPDGTVDDGALTVDKIELEEAGPLRTVVRLEGKTNSKEPERIIMRLEAYAGRSYVRMFHTIEFLQDDPRKVYMSRMGVSLPLDLDAKQAKATAGAQAGAAPIADAGSCSRVGLTQDSIMHFTAWAQHAATGAADRFRSVAQEGNRSRGWLDISDQRGGVTVMLRNMWQEAPSELVVNTGAAGKGGPSFDVDLWPASAPPMDMRRYSNYGHISQGESAGEENHDDSDWIDQVYYAPGRGPVEGVSKTHEFLIYFHDTSVATPAIDSLAADFQSPALIYAGAKWYADTKITLPTIAPGDPSFKQSDKNMDDGFQFLLFHQKYWNWYGFWDYGDVGHMFKRGYGQYIPAKKLADLLKMPQKQRDNIVGKDMEKMSVVDYWPQHDWAFDNGRWGWSNTEGLSNLFMQTEYFRSGDRDLYFFTEAAAREARDVVMRHEGKYFGFGTRHGVQHWSDGNHEHRQTINSEFRYQYYLSGDMRSAEWAKELTDNFYMKEPIDSDNDADHAARIYGLVFAWERTNDPVIAQTLKNYIHSVCVPQGIDICAPVSFPNGQRTQAEPRKLNEGSFFFQYFGSMHGLLEYYELTHDPVVRTSIIKFSDGTVGDMLGGDGKKSPPILAQAFAARYADDKQTYRHDLLVRIRDGTREMSALAYATWPTDPAHWTGLSAPVTHYPSAMFWLNSEGYVMGALDKEPTLAPDQMKKVTDHEVYTGAMEKGQSKVQIPSQRESWQNEFDDPALKSYCTPKLPLEP